MNAAARRRSAEMMHDSSAAERKRMKIRRPRRRIGGIRDEFASDAGQTAANPNDREKT
jgi:hypothetical protein